MNQDIKVVPNILAISEDLEFNISQEPQEFLENGVIVNIITSNNKLMVQTLSNKYSFQWNFFQFENKALKNLRDAFLNEPNNIENYKKACEVFKPLREYLLNFDEENEKPLSLTPSVNLLPIPPSPMQLICVVTLTPL